MKFYRMMCYVANLWRTWFCQFYFRTAGCSCSDKQQHCLYEITTVHLLKHQKTQHLHHVREKGTDSALGITLTNSNNVVIFCKGYYECSAKLLTQQMQCLSSSRSVMCVLCIFYCSMSPPRFSQLDLNLANLEATVEAEMEWILAFFFPATSW